MCICISHSLWLSRYTRIYMCVCAFVMFLYIYIYIYGLNLEEMHGAAATRAATRVVCVIVCYVHHICSRYSKGMYASVQLRSSEGLCVSAHSSANTGTIMLASLTSL
jgi:hypothetical protein